MKTTKATITQSNGDVYNFEGYLIALISDYLEKGARIASDTGTEIRLEFFSAWSVIKIENEKTTR